MEELELSLFTLKMMYFYKILKPFYVKQEYIMTMFQANLMKMMMMMMMDDDDEG